MNLPEKRAPSILNIPIIYHHAKSQKKLMSHSWEKCQTEEIFDCYLQAKNQLHPSCFPWDIAKILSACCFGYFGHAWLCTPKVALSTYRNPLCLSADGKSISSPMLFWRYWKICKFLILSTWSIVGYTHPKCFELVEDINVYLHAKNKLHHSLLSWDIITF